MSAQLVETITVGPSGLASITFSNIPQRGSHLMLLVSNRSSFGGPLDNILWSINSASGKNFWIQNANGSFATADVSGNAGVIVGNTGSSQTFGTGRMIIYEYSKSINHAMITDSTGSNYDSTGYQLALVSGQTNTAVPVTSVTISAYGTQLLENSMVSLYILP